MAANPFLFTEDEYVSPNAGNSNPFLMSDDCFPDAASNQFGMNDNPFLSQSAATMAPEQVQGGGATNPFAFDPMDLEPSEAQPAQTGMFEQPHAFAANTGNIFTEASQMQADFLIDTTASIPQKPTDLDLKYTNSVATDAEANGLQPKRPPPPRPPPSKETQDLFMSVMGEMDAASSHLLDRIPPTRTPSPVSMRDLHSPSPTPEPQFGDLLDVSDAKTETIGGHQPTSIVQDDLLMMGDDFTESATAAPDMLSQQPAMPQPSQPTQYTMPEVVSPPQQTFIPPPVRPAIPPQPVLPPQPVIPPQPVVPSQPVVPPTRPAPPSRPVPPRPAPPQKPPPPVIAQTPQVPPPVQAAAPPPKPPAPHVTAPPPKPPPPVVPPAPKQEDDIMDMFGSTQTAPKSAADIMNLYKPEPAAIDLLSDTLDAPQPDPESSESNSRKSSIPSDTTVVQNPVATTIEPVVDAPVEVADIADVQVSPQQPADFLSPQQDMQMDTSDSQSKESVSSATFNPFAAVEETSPTNPSVIPTQDFSNQEFAPMETNQNYQTPTILDNSSYQAPMEVAYSSSTNIFASNSDSFTTAGAQISETNVFATPAVDTFSSTTNTFSANSNAFGNQQDDAFDAFTAKFESAKDENRNGGAFDAFGGSGGGGIDTWGADEPGDGFGSSGFGNEEAFDSFLAMQEPPSVPQSTPYKMSKAGSLDSDEEKDFTVVIRPKGDDSFGGACPILAPPPPVTNQAYADPSRINPFDQSETVAPTQPDFTLPMGKISIRILNSNQN